MTEPSSLRVLVITRIFPNALEPLSAPFNRQQFAALGRRCHVEVLAAIPWYPGASLMKKWSAAGRLVDVPARDTIDGLSVEHPRVFFLPRYGHLFSGALEAASLLPAVLRRRGRVDVVLGSWAFPDGAAAVALARMLSVPAVVKAHGSDINVFSGMKGPAVNLRLALPRAERVVAVSRSLAGRIVELGVAPERIAVVENGVDGSLFHPRDRALARRQLGMPTKGRLIVYCGRVSEPKGVFELMEAFAQARAAHPDLSLVLVGEGGARAACEERARALGGSVRFVGPRPLAEVPVWMAASDLVTLPSWNEGSPNVIREALACGRPVVATRVGGIPELVTSEALGELVPVRDAGALAAALARVAGRVYDAESIARLGSGGWDESAARLLEVLEAAVRGRPPVAEVA